jgi:outer membrane protein assembly factor BamB
MHCKYPLTILLATLTLWSCQKDSLQPNVPPPPATLKLEVLWQQPLMPDTGRYTGDAQFVNNGGIVYSINFISPSGTVNKRNGNTGELIWSFGAFDRPASFNPSEQVFNVLGNTLVNVQDFTYFLDISGNLVWKKDVREKNGSSFYFSQLIGDYLYTIHYEGNNPGIESSSIVRTILMGKPTRRFGTHPAH